MWVDFVTNWVVVVECMSVCCIEIWTDCQWSCGSAIARDNQGNQQSMDPACTPAHDDNNRYYSLHHSITLGYYQQHNHAIISNKIHSHIFDIFSINAIKNNKVLVKYTNYVSRGELLCVQWICWYLGYMGHHWHSSLLLASNALKCQWKASIYVWLVICNVCSFRKMSIHAIRQLFWKFS